MLPLSLLLLIPSVFAQNAPSIVCMAGQCIQGTLNTTIGATLSVPGRALQLLPGTYTSTTNPQLLHDTLTSSSASLQASAGFNSSSSSSVTLPLNLELAPGLSTYSGVRYSGQAAFTSLPVSSGVNTTTNLSGQSIAISNNVWIAVGRDRTIIWDPVPDINQLPSSVSALTLTDIQSSGCSPACSSNSFCTSSGTCQCSPGFTGSSCESCAPGFFGPSCQGCPSDCDQCDDGISGSGRCIRPQVSNSPSKCNCKNGVCGADGECTCIGGFGTASNDAQQCASCVVGFFLTDNGNCEACQPGCTFCASGTGECTLCPPGTTKNSNDPTKCTLPPQVDSNNQLCPVNTFNNNGVCASCSNLCASCTGPYASDCVTCTSGLYSFAGTCIRPTPDGVCEETDLIADTVKVTCTSCGPNCASCRIPGFGPASTIDKKECTACLPGTFLHNGQCVEQCPAGTVVSQNGSSCVPCDSGCATCAGSPSFCLTCSSNLVASAGRCVSSCPSGTVQSSSGGSCQTCHPDCASCSGPSFTQCTACPSNRPVLSNGRCLPTCSKSQFFDKASGTCQECDSSCGSCSGSGGSQCLSCSSPNQVLRAGSCVAANCASNTNVVSNLGICLSELVISSTPTSSPDPQVSDINAPTVVSKKRRLQWWQILLMALGCAFLFVLVILLFRRRQRQKRAQRTNAFAAGQRQRGSPSWFWKLRAGVLFQGSKAKKSHFAEEGSEYGKGLSGDDEYVELKGRKLKVLRLGSGPLVPDRFSSDGRYPNIKHITTDAVNVPFNDFDTDLERGYDALRSPTHPQSRLYSLPSDSDSDSKLMKPHPPFATDSPRTSGSHSHNGSTSGLRISRPLPSKDLMEEEDIIHLIRSYDRPVSSSRASPFKAPVALPSDDIPVAPQPQTRTRLNTPNTRIAPRSNGVGMRPMVSIKKQFGWKRQPQSPVNTDLPDIGPYQPNLTSRPISATSSASTVASVYSQMTTKILKDDMSRGKASGSGSHTRKPMPPLVKKGPPAAGWF